MVLRPPKFVPIVIQSSIPTAWWASGEAPGDNYIGYPKEWEVTMVVNSQMHADYGTPTPMYYDGGDIAVGMYIVTGSGGNVLKIKSISSQGPNNLTCIAEDEDGENLLCDVSQSGNGGISDGDGYVFEIINGFAITKGMTGLPPSFNANTLSEIHSRFFRKLTIAQDITNLDNRVTQNETDITDLQTRVTTVEGDVVTINNALTANTTLNNTQNTRITNLETAVASLVSGGGSANLADVILYDNLSDEIDGSRTTFTTTFPYMAGSLMLSIGGVVQEKDFNYGEVAPGSGVLTVASILSLPDDSPMVAQYVRTSNVAIPRPGPGPINIAPTVSVGSDVTITLPADGTLSAIISDDGLPGPAMSTLWSQVSGPGTATFANPNIANTTVSFDIAGSYVLRLTASDSILSTSDDIIYTVLPAGVPVPPPPPPPVNPSATGVYVIGQFTRMDRRQMYNAAILTDAGWNMPWPGILSSDVNSAETVATFTRAFRSGDVQAAADGTVYFGGDFTRAGSSQGTYCIAKWDGTDFGPVGYGLNLPVCTICVHSSGDIYAGGHFTELGGGWGGTIKHIARYRNSDLPAGWTQVGGGVNGIVYKIIEGAGGVIYVGGQFTLAGGVAASNIAKWDGTAWTTLGSGVNGTVYDMCFDDAGNLYAAGEMNSAGGISVNGIARWDGSSWSNNVGGIYGPVGAVHFVNGILYAGTITAGNFGSMVVRWDGSSWSAMGELNRNTEVLRGVTKIASDTAGNIYVAGHLASGDGIPTYGIAKWNGTMWESLAQGTRTTATGYAWRLYGSIMGMGTYGTVNTGWSRLSDYPLPIVSTSCVVLPGNKIFSTGGIYGPGPYTCSNTYVWDGLSWNLKSYSLWSRRGSAICYVASTNKVYTAAGVYDMYDPYTGSISRSGHNKLQVYDVASDTWSWGADMPLLPMPECFRQHTWNNMKMVEHNGVIHFPAGFKGRVFKYNISIDSWSLNNNTTTGPQYDWAAEPGSVVNGSKIYIFGGSKMDKHDNIYDYSDVLSPNYLWEYDAATETWTMIHDGSGANFATAPYSRYSPHMFMNAAGTDIYVLYGSQHSSYDAYVFLNEMWSFNLSTLTWTNRSSLLNACMMPRFNVGSHVVAMNGFLYILGGRVISGNIYDPDLLSHYSVGQFNGGTYTKDFWKMALP